MFRKACQPARGHRAALEHCSEHVVCLLDHICSNWTTCPGSSVSDSLDEQELGRKMRENPNFREAQASETAATHMMNPEVS